MSKIDPTVIRSHLIRVLTSETLHDAQKTQRLIEFVVTKTLEGVPSEVTEERIGKELYGPTFKGSKRDNRVRQVARTARRKLDEFYRKEGAADDIQIKLGRYRYRATFEPGPESSKVPAEGHATSSGGPCREFDRDACFDYLKRHRIPLKQALGPDLNNIDLFDSPTCTDGKSLLCLCSVVRIRGRNVLLLPSASSIPDTEGVGRTSLLMRLLRISFSYGEIIGLKASDLPDQIVPDVQTQHDCSLLASDMATVMASDGSLVVRHLQAERIGFVWDLARHVFRMTTPDYITALHREGGVHRERLFEIFLRIQFQPLEQLFSTSPDAEEIPVHLILILRQEFPGPDLPPKLHPLVGERARVELREALNSAASHGSSFWKKRAISRQHGAVSLVGKIGNAGLLPPMYEILVSRPNRRAHSQYVFDDIAKRLLRLLESSSEPAVLSTLAETPEITETHIHSDLHQMRAFRGIRRHNDLLISHIRDAKSPLKLDLLVTSGRKLFNEVAFWSSLLDAAVPIQLTVLFLNPVSATVRKRQFGAYRDKKPDFLRSEIAANIETLQRMNGYLKQRGKRVTIISGLYKQIANFRMTFFGNGHLLVAPYGPHSRVGAETLFFHLRSLDPGDLFSGFRQEYLRIYASAKIHEL